MLDMTVGYLTESGNWLSLEIAGRLMRRNSVPLFYPKEDLRLLCGDCKGWSGGCPDYAPYFDQLKPSMGWFYAIMVRLDTAWPIKYAGDNEYFRWSYSDRLTESYAKRITKRMLDNPLFINRSMYRLVAGGCRICNASVGYCLVIKDLPCAHPEQRTYSIEATGVDCSELHNRLFGERIPYWYYDGALPQYMVRYVGLMLPYDSLGGIDMELGAAVTSDKSYTRDVPNKPHYRLVKRTAPDHVTADAGLEYNGYAMNEDGSYELVG